LKSVFENINHPIRVVVKGIWRDFINIRRYKIGLLGWFLSMTIGVGAGYLFSVLFEFNPTTAAGIGISTSTQIFVFFVGGVGLSTFSDTALWAPMNRVNQDIHYGTLEAVFVSPTSRIAYLLSPIIADSILNLIFFIPAYILLMVLNGTITNFYVIGTTLLIVLLTITSMIAFGLFFAMIAILLRRVQPMAIFLSMIFQFICGAYVPVQTFALNYPIFGSILKYFALIFPYTYCYDLFRYFTFGSSYQILFPVWVELLILLVTSVLFVILAYFLIKVVERKAKKTGLSIL
jgi:ABC-2 type transport system permease protein